MEKITILYHALIVASGVMVWLMTDIANRLNVLTLFTKYGKVLTCDKCLSFWSGLLAGLFLYKSWECLILAVLSVVMIKVLKNITKQDFL